MSCSYAVNGKIRGTKKKINAIKGLFLVSRKEENISSLSKKILRAYRLMLNIKIYRLKMKHKKVDGAKKHKWVEI